jgi:hypothetical protein
MAIYLAFTGILASLIYRKTVNIWYLIVILSPVTLLFPILDSSVAGRKEIMLFFLYALFILCLNRQMLKSSFVILCFSLALLLATLFHELLFFYTPYFVFALWIRSKADKETFPLSNAILVMLGPFLAMIPLYLFGQNIDGPAICRGLTEMGLTGNICNGILSDANKLGAGDVFRIATSNHYFSNYSAALLLGLIPFVLFIKHAANQTIGVKIFLIAFLFLLLFSSPLFVLAIDWGRWLNIHFVLLLCLSTLFLKKQPWSAEKRSFSQTLELPSLWKAKTLFSKHLNNLLFLTGSFVYLTFWSMLHYGSFPLVSFRHFSKLDKLFQLFLQLF